MPSAPTIKRSKTEGSRPNAKASQPQLQRSATEPPQRAKAKLKRRKSQVTKEDFEMHDVGQQKHIEEDIHALERLRETLVEKFGSEEAAFDALDWNSNGLLSFKELHDSIEDWGFDIDAITEGVELRHVFSLLDIDGSGQLSINEFMDTSPWRAEDQAILLLRQTLTGHFGSTEEVLKVLDVNADGSVSYLELEATLKEHDINITEATGGTELGRVFDIMDYDLSGELSIQELMNADPRKEAARRDEAINNFRHALLDFFGTPENIMAKVDTNLNGKLSLGEFKDGLDRCRFDFRKILGYGSSFEWMFRVLDVHHTREIDIEDLLVVDPEKIAHEEAEQRRKRYESRRKKGMLLDDEPGRRRGAVMERPWSVPEDSPRPVDSLSPAIKKIALFGLTAEGNLPDGFRNRYDEDDDEDDVAFLNRTRRGAVMNLDLHVLANSAKPEVVEVAELDLSRAYILEKGAGRLAKAMLEPRFQYLEVLRVGGNYIGPRGVRWLATAAERQGFLRYLGLAWNHIDDECANRLGTMITRLETLKELDLSFNRIGAVGAKSLVLALEKKPPLATLILRHNYIDRLSVNRLRRAAREVVDIDLYGNIGDEESNAGCIGPAVPVKVGPGGFVLPQIQATSDPLVCAGWPRRSTTRGSPRADAKATLTRKDTSKEKLVPNDSASVMANSTRSSKQGSSAGFSSKKAWKTAAVKIASTRALAGASASSRNLAARPQTASSLEKIVPSTWPASTQLAKSLSEAALAGCQDRCWSRKAARKNVRRLEEAFPKSSVSNLDIIGAPQMSLGERSDMRGFRRRSLGEQSGSEQSRAWG